MFLRAPLSGVIAAVLLGSAFSSSTPRVSAAEPKDDGPAEGWVVRTFRLPADVVLPHFVPFLPPIDPFAAAGSSPPPALGPLPPDDASDEIWVDYLRQSTVALPELLALQGLWFPEGSVLAYDKESTTLIVRTTAQTMDYLAAVADEAAQSLRKSLAFDLEVFEADRATIGAIVEETRTVPDHLHALETLLASAGNTGVRHVAALRIETADGQRVQISAGGEHSVPLDDSFKVDRSGRVLWQREDRCIGTRLEVDPALDQYRWSARVKVDFESHYAAPVERVARSAPSLAHGTIELPVADFHCARVKSTLTFVDGTARLLGVWNTTEADMMQAAFLRTHFVRVVPPLNEKLEAKFRRLADRAVPAPAPPPASQASGGGLTRDIYSRRFLVPQGFLTLLTPSGLPADDLEKLPVKEWLEANGVSFKEGGKASYHPDLSHLIVTTTEENMKRIEKLAKELHRRFHPRILAFTLHVVQGDRAILSPLLSSTAKDGDSSEAWPMFKKLADKGEATILRTLRLDAASGQRALFEAGLERAEFFDARDADPAEKSLPPTPQATTGGKAAQETAPSTTPTAKDSAQDVILALDRRTCGLRLEVESTLDALDPVMPVLVAMEYHYAPPTVRPALPEAGGKAIRIDLPETEFHRANVVTEIQTVSGMTKLLGFWKPEGAPEYEGKDVMQAAFLRVDVVPVGKE